MGIYRVLSIVFLCFFITGCSGFEMSKTDEILNAPLGSGGLYLGMTKHKVISMYGEPDLKGEVTSKVWMEPREEWFYRGRYGVLPVNAGYLSEDLYLYFDGEHLTNVSKKSLGKSDQRGPEDAKKSAK